MQHKGVLDHHCYSSSNRTDSVYFERMEVNKSHIITAAVSLAIGLIAGLLLRGCGHEEPAPEPKVVSDTIFITDTFRIAGKTKTIYETEWDTLFEVKHDTLRDTIRLTLPIEHKEYRDTFTTDSSRIELGVRYQGYKAKIDSIDLQYRFEVEPRMYEKKRDWRWAVTPSIQVGYGASIVGQQVYAAPYVGVGVSVGFGYTWKK